MKQIFIFILLLYSLTFLPAQDQIEREITLKMMGAGYQLKTSQYGKLAEGESMFKNFQYLPEYDYIIVAYGEKGVLDCDVKILNKNNQVLAKDTEADALATCKFSPAEAAYLRTLITNYNSEARGFGYVIKYLLFWRLREE